MPSGSLVCRLSMGVLVLCPAAVTCAQGLQANRFVQASGISQSVTQRADQPQSESERIAAMEKIADLALIPPVLNTSPLPEYDYDRLDYGMTIGMERMPVGSSSRTRS